MTDIRTISKRPPIELLPCGNKLAAWLRAGSRPDRAGKGIGWAYRWRGHWFDRNWSLQERLYSPSSQLQPIFVLGLWRSGTTYLHELLTASVDANSPRTWQCFDPSAFRLKAKPLSGRTVQRPMDAVLVDALSPQEDEFALMAAGADSAYRFFLDPRRWRELLPALHTEHWAASGLSAAWIRELSTFLGWCVEDPHKPLIVKSPNHLFRAKALKAIWPQAKFVWVVRAPEQVWHSNLRMWKAMAQRYALWFWQKGDLENFVEACFEAYLDVLVQLRGTNYAPIDSMVCYDELVRAPESTVTRIVAELDLLSGFRPDRLSATAERLQSYDRSGIAPAGFVGRHPLFASISKEHQSMLDQRNLLIPEYA